MSGNVIDFPIKVARPEEDAVPADNYIWQCNCGSKTFHLLHGGIVVCSECTVYAHDLIWGFPRQDQT